jgi:hypothetical protein
MWAVSDRYVAAMREAAAIPTPRCQRHLTYLLASCPECRETQRVKR